MGALITCCRKPKPPPCDAPVVNEEVNIKNGEVVVESRTEPESKYEYDGGEVVEESLEVAEVKAVHAAPPPPPSDDNNDNDSTPNESGNATVHESTVTVAGRTPDGEFQRTTIIRESVETRTVTSKSRSSIPMLKPTPEGKPRPKVVIVREY